VEKTYPESSYSTPVKDQNENPMKKPVFTPPLEITPKRLYTELLKQPIEISDPNELERYKTIQEKYKNLKKLELQRLIMQILPGFPPPSFTIKQLKQMLANSNFNGVKKIAGKGMHRVIRGRGNTPESKIGHLYGGRYSINPDKLKQCILHVYYTKSRASLPGLKSETINIDMRDMLLDILHQRFNIKVLNALIPDEQRIVSNFVNTTKIDLDLSEFDEAYARRYQVLKGEIQSGNNSPIILKEFKQFVNRGLQENLITRNEAMNMLLMI
jgi:hypothetical protein